MKFSINYFLFNDKGENMKKKKQNKKQIFIKELKPEITQCRIVQVEKKINGK